MAMSLGEDIIAQGRMSELLSYNLNLYQGYFAFFFKNEMKRIKITADRYEKYPSAGQATICPFSGGIDSFYTLLKNNKKTASIKNYFITHLLHVEGFEQNQEGNDDHYKKMRQGCLEVAQKMNLGLIVLRTNVRDLIDPYVNWGQRAHGAVLASCGLILKNYAARYYIPSTLDFRAPYVWASNPATDFLLSTENLEIIHHGAETTRIKKLEYIANFPICYDHFKVCWTEKGMANCGHCDKCVRAIISLYMFGRLEKFTTFPKKFNRATTKKWEIKTEIGRYFAREVLTYARQHYPKFARRINRAIIMNHPKNIFRKWILAPLYRASYRAKEKYPFYRRLLSKLRPGY